MNVVWSKEGRPVGCSHDVPPEWVWRLSLGLTGLAVGLWIAVAVGDASFEVVLFHLANIAAAFGGVGVVDMMIQDRRQLGRGEVTDLIELKHLLEKACEHDIELEPLPRDLHEQITNAELKHWARRANEALINDALRRVGAAMRESQA